jgi:hypothetical protein
LFVVSGDNLGPKSTAKLERLTTALIQAIKQLALEEERRDFAKRLLARASGLSKRERTWNERARGADLLPVQINHQATMVKKR